MSEAEPVDLEGAVWLRRDALDDGLTDKQIRRLVGSGEWYRVRRGAYCSGALWAELSAADRHRVLCRAVLRTAHPSTVLSHVSAAVERGVPVWGVSLKEVHTTRTDGKCGRREAGIVHHRGVLPKDHVELLHGIPVTSAARTVIEVCTVAGVDEALVTAHGMLHAGHTTIDTVRALANETRFWPSSLSTRLVLDLAHPKIESPLESRLWHFFWSEHLPRPEPQVEILDERGWLAARVDFAWVDVGVFLEADGREKYLRLRRPGETLEAFLMREKKREELVCLLTGWVCIRVTWRDLDDRRLLARRIRGVLASRTVPA
jgi:hypothetical protein